MASQPHICIIAGTNSSCCVLQEVKIIFFSHPEIFFLSDKKLGSPRVREASSGEREMRESFHLPKILCSFIHKKEKERIFHNFYLHLKPAGSLVEIDTKSCV